MTQRGEHAVCAQVFPDDIRYLKGVGEKRAELYNKLGVDGVSALLRFYPRDYLDFTSPLPIADATRDRSCVIRARVFAKNPEQRIRAGLTIFKVFATDDVTDVVLTFFNSRYAVQGLEEGREYLFYGRVNGTLLSREMSAPLYFPVTQELGLVPIYPLTAGLTSRMIAQNVKQALTLIDEHISDPLPFELRREHELCHLAYALKVIHFPPDPEQLAVARKRLVFEELLTLQLALVLLRRRPRQTASTVVTRTDATPFFDALPFALTGAQQRAINEGLADMQKTVPMNRLVQGDVGSGKTAVAAALCYVCAKNDAQSALMAPTEILARQHYASLAPLLEGAGISCALLTGSTKAAQRRDILARLSSGELSFVVGTHALLTPELTFHRLGLVVTDEQHRFGVGQRASLADKGGHPHVLVMSATPIPRTLALIIYGDLDISVIDELPPGRRAVKTYLIDSAKRHRALGFIRHLLDEGRQAYVVCPVIEESESDLVSATEYAQRLVDEDFRGYRVGLVHGRLKAAEKEKIMRRFYAGEISLLVSTTVIEVGVDVPNAAVMMIENAERFGLSQLHQLRGRVGRGKHESFCILVSDAHGEQTLRRLKAMCATTDGFKLAEEDLKLRGPGDFFGARQHGLPEMRLASLIDDVAMLTLAQGVARSLLETDETLSLPEHAGLRENIKALFGSMSAGSFN
ncbi:MAG: ATP-dependent DNA helicase RecG [Acetanaerobacterium sp.]